MLHKFFHWWYLRRRSSYGTTYKKIDNRSQDRDLINYFHDFGGGNYKFSPIILAVSEDFSITHCDYCNRVFGLVFYGELPGPINL